MRLIDADALKADLKQYFTDGVLDGISARLAFNQILHDIDNAPTVERPQGEWIPVSERLPEQANQTYLVTVDFGGGQLLSCAMYFYGGDIGWNYEGITAWMPLPEAYKEETDNEHL